MYRRILCIGLLLLGIPFLLAACGGEKHGPAGIPLPAAYETQALALPEGRLLGCCSDGEAMFILLQGRGAGALYHADPAAGTVEQLRNYAPTQDIEERDRFLRVTVDGPLLAADGSLWIWETQSSGSYHPPEDFDWENGDPTPWFSSLETTFRICWLDPATGEEQASIDLSNAIRELGVNVINDWAIDREGLICLILADRIAVLDQNGQLLFQLEASGPSLTTSGTSGGTAVNLPDGQIAVLVEDHSGNREARVLDTPKRNWSNERFPLPRTVDTLYSGSGGYLFYYMDVGALWGWPLGGTQAQKLADWSAARLSGGAVMCFALSEAGELAALTVNGDTPRLLLLTPAEGHEDGRTVLTLGTIDMGLAGANSSLRRQVEQFNADSDDCYIIIRNYADGLSKDAAGHAAAVTRATTELLAGNIPDILNFSLDTLAQRGYLEDLWPWIDSDPTLNRDGLMSHVLDCAATDGKLYQVASGFSISTAVALADVAGGRESWTLEELLAAYAAMPEGASIAGEDLSPEGLLRYLLPTVQQRFVDRKAGTCSFDSQAFMDILALCGSQTGESTYTDTWTEGGRALRENRQLLVTAELTTPRDLTYYEVLCGGPDALWDYGAMLEENEVSSLEVRSTQAAIAAGSALGQTYAADTATGALKDQRYAAYVGFPTDSGSGSFFRLYGDCLSISAACAHKEDAWSFVRRLLLPGAYRTYGVAALDGQVADTFAFCFPMNKGDFEHLMAPRWFTDDRGSYETETIGDAFLQGKDGQPVEAAIATLTLGSPVQIAAYQLSPTPAQYESFWSLYDAIDSVGWTDSTISGIVQEQAARCFAGQQTLYDTARAIQDRVTLYLGE